MAVVQAAVEDVLGFLTDVLGVGEQWLARRRQAVRPVEEGEEAAAEPRAAALDATEVGGRGLMLGVLGTVQGAGGAIGQALGGVSNAAWGPLAPFKIGALFLVAALILTLMHLHHQRRSASAIPNLA